jgi:hypothetical protein
VTGCRNEFVMWPGVGQPTVLLTFTMSNISLTRSSIKKNRYEPERIASKRLA